MKRGKPQFQCRPRVTATEGSAGGPTVALTALLLARLQAGLVLGLPDQVSLVLVKLGVVLFLQGGDFCLIPLADVDAPAWTTTGLGRH